MMLDRIAKVVPQWTAEVSGYASVLAMYAFALEIGKSPRRRVRAARPGSRSGILDRRFHYHADGNAGAATWSRVLAAVESAWGEGTGLSVHLAWHRALFHLDANNPEGALAIYDTQIATVVSADMASLSDGSALLWRFQLQDIDVGERWRLLADRWAMHNLAGARPFYLVHAMMAFVRQGVPQPQCASANPPKHHRGNGASSLSPEDALAAPLCEALLAFARRDYTACVEWLKRVRHIAHRCGGSLAQCDVIHLMLTEAALRARQARFARALVAERTARTQANELAQSIAKAASGNTAPRYH